MHAVAEWPAETGRGYFELVVFSDLNPIRKTQRRRAKEMNMEITGTPELRVLEVVMLKIGDGMAHIFRPRQKRFLPDHGPIAKQAACSFERPRKPPDTELRAKRAVPKL